ncbi:MAG: type II secretion system protein [Bdellovibrionaceae bacterium]|nr:type II secretion system protein [Pseudobdellovibrionaceae bacterium]
MKPNKNTVIKKQMGFSLVEILVALGILSVAALAGSQLIMNLLSAQKGIAVDSKLQDILNESRMAFKNPAQCSANISNFSTKILSAANFKTLKITVSKWSLNGNNFLINNGAITGINDSKVNLSIEKFQQISTTEYKAFAIFDFDRGNLVGGKSRIRELPINLITSSDVITSCSFSSVELLSQHDLDLIKSDVCSSLGGTFNSGTQKCSSTPVSKEVMCNSFGGTFNSSTEKCSISSTINSQIAAVGTCPLGNVATGVDSFGKITCKPQATNSASSSSSSSTSAPSNSVTSSTSVTNTTTTTSKNCAGGSFSKTSPNGSNSCDYTWPGAGPYQTVTGTASVGSITGTCQPDGTWQHDYICPDKTGTTCGGGSKIWYSLSGKTACNCSFDQAGEGQSRTATCDNGSASGSCTAGGWSYSVSCKDPNTITCNGGNAVVGSASNANKTCSCNYNTTSAGKSSKVPCTNGGSLSGTCSSSGEWIDLVINCP